MLPQMHNAAINGDNTSNATTDSEKSDNAAMCGDNTHNATTGDGNTDNTTTGDGNTDTITTGDGYTDNATTGDSNTHNTATGDTSTVDVPLPLHYGKKTKDPSKVKTSKKCTPIIVEPSIGDPLPDEITTVKVSGYTFDLTDVRIYEFLIQGTPKPLDLEGIEEDQLLEIQRNIQVKFKQRD